MLCLSPKRFSFPVLHSFLSFSVVSLKVHSWLPISEYVEVTFFTIQLLAVLLLYLFSQMGGIPLCWFESLSLHSLFYTSSFWFPEVPPICAMRSRWVFLLFLLGHLILEKDVPILCFLCSLYFLAFFLLSCLNPSLTVLHASRIPSFFAVSEDANSAFFFNLLIWTSFLFLPSFLINFRACPFFFFMFFGLQAFWAYHFFPFPWPLALISLGLGVVTF